MKCEALASPRFESCASHNTLGTTLRGISYEDCINQLRPALRQSFVSDVWLNIKNHDTFTKSRCHQWGIDGKLDNWIAAKGLAIFGLNRFYKSSLVSKHRHRYNTVNTGSFVHWGLTINYSVHSSGRCVLKSKLGCL